MTAKERLHRLVDRLSDQEAEEALRVLGAGLRAPDTDADGEAETASLPEAWGTTLTGEPMPDTAAAVRRSRAMH
jgi:hypothetical protein